MEQLLAHLIGDYGFQTTKMAVEKSRSWKWAIIHVITYTIPFVFLTRNLLALGIIFSTHLIIDRFSLAKYLLRLKGAPENGTYTYPDGLSVPCYIGNLFLVYAVTDNMFHLLINYLALKL